MGTRVEAVGSATEVGLMPAKKTTAKKTTAKKTTAKKTTAKKTTAKKTTARKTTVRKTKAKATARTATARARRGDLIVVDSPQVGTPPREGEVLRVIHGEIRVSYRVRWSDGHETLISPAAGAATIVRS